MKPRISLRGLLFLTACLAAFCYWRDRPRQVANQFVIAFNAKDQAVVNLLFPPEIKCGTVFPFVERNGQFTAVREQQSLGEWFRGACRIGFNIRRTASLNGYAIASALGINDWRGSYIGLTSRPTQGIPAAAKSVPNSAPQS